MSLSGLRGEERWVYCEEMLGDLGLTVDREDPELTKLMELLDGHPLPMRDPKVEKITAVSLREMPALVGWQGQAVPSARLVGPHGR